MKCLIVSIRELRGIFYKDHSWVPLTSYIDAAERNPELYKERGLLLECDTEPGVIEDVDSLKRKQAIHVLAEVINDANYSNDSTSPDIIRIKWTINKDGTWFHRLTDGDKLALKLWLGKIIDNDIEDAMSENTSRWRGFKTVVEIGNFIIKMMDAYWVLWPEETK